MTVYEMLDERYNDGNKYVVSPFIYVTMGCNR